MAEEEYIAAQGQDDAEQNAGQDSPADELASAFDEVQASKEKPKPLIETLVDESGEITAELACKSCGYDLHGLRAGDRCPECGQDVFASLRSNQLYHANTDWLRSLKRGTNWLLATIAGYLVWIVYSYFAAVAEIVTTNATSPWAIFKLSTNAVLTIAFAYSFILLTATEPGSTRRAYAQHAARWLLLTMLATRGLAAVFGYAQDPAIDNIVQTLIYGSRLLLIAGVIAMTIAWVQIVSRIPDKGLAKQIKSVGVGLSTSLIVMHVGVIWLSQIIGQQQGLRYSAIDDDMLVACMICPSIIALLVFGVWLILTIVFMRQQINTTIKHALKRNARIKNEMGQSAS